MGDMYIKPDKKLDEMMGEYFDTINNLKVDTMEDSFELDGLISVDNGYLFTVGDEAINIDKIISFRIADSTGSYSKEVPKELMVEAVLYNQKYTGGIYITDSFGEDKDAATYALFDIIELIQNWKEAHRSTELQQDV